MAYLDLDVRCLIRRLTHWGGVTHICVCNLTIISSDNGLSSGRRRTVIWTNVGVLSIRPLKTNFSEILIEIQTFSFKKMHLKILSGKCRPFCLGLNVLNLITYSLIHSQIYVSLHYGKITLKPNAWWYLVKGIKTKRLLCFLSLVAALHDYDIYIGKTEVTQNFQSSGHQVSVHSVWHTGA